MSELEERTYQVQKEPLTPMQKTIQEWQAERAARASQSLGRELEDIAIAVGFSAIVMTMILSAAQAIENLSK